jgi:hypothetical protein
LSDVPSKTGKIQVVSQPELAKKYDVKDGEFLFDGKDTYRVNSDGQKINLKMWELEEDGEFYRITKRIKGPTNVVVYQDVTQNYAKRVMIWDGNAKYAPFGLGAVGIFFTFGALVALVNMAFTVSLIVAVPCSALAAFMFIAAAKTNKATIVGPQPLKRKTDDFGPTAAAASGNHPASDDLDYKPTV